MNITPSQFSAPIIIPEVHLMKIQHQLFPCSVKYEAGVHVMREKENNNFYAVEICSFAEG
jgi:hypothetical protein